MFKMKPVMMFVANILLILLSWVFYKFPQGDEYLVLFVISLIFIISPYVLTLLLTGVLFALNLAFFVFYRFIGALNSVDVAVLMALLAVSFGISYLVKLLFDAFVTYHRDNLSKVQQEYNNLVDRLDNIEREGRGTESELGRISGLYEVTKQLAPVLKFEGFFDALFDFLEDNFRFKTAHLLTFSNGKFSRGVSKNIKGEDYHGKEEKVLDYEAVVEYLKEQDNKPVFVERQATGKLFDSMNVRADTFLAFPLFVNDNISAILAIEGAAKSSFPRFRILIPQVTLELRKVELYEQVQKLSIIDGLTEVYLRRYLMTRLEEEVDRARRLGLTFSIGMVDIDYFKECNDKYGHLVGDTVLKKVAQRLKKSVREVDMIARYGGEEFCIVLPETTKEFAKTVAERLRESVESKEIKAFDENVKMTVSVGISGYPEDGEDAPTLIDKADTALYKAKRKGRNTVHVL
ncbi:MAG: GGDEF domain-containing protein [Candidatus Omnitrophota bacterium]